MRIVLALGLILSVLLIVACAKQPATPQTPAQTPGGQGPAGSAPGIGEGASAITGAETTVSGCTDTDGGRVYNIKGTTTPIVGSVQTDRCVGTPNLNPTRLKEFYCQPDGTRGEEYYDCPNSCQEGACV